MKILLAVDGSEFTRSAIEFLARLPFPEGSALTLVAVAPDLAREGRHDAGDEIDEAAGTARAEAERVLAEAAALAEAAGLDTTSIVRTGSVADEIMACGAKLGVDLIAVGSHGLRGIRRFLLGSVAQKVVTYAASSVLIVRPSQSEDGLRVLVAHDGSEPSRAGVTRFARLGRTKWCAIKIIDVLELITTFRMDIRQRLSESWKLKKKAAKASLAEAERELAPIAAEIDSELVESGHPAETILDAAKAFGTDLILIGGTGKGRLERVLLGSVSSRVAAHAECSVWVAR